MPVFIHPNATISVMLFFKQKNVSSAESWDYSQILKQADVNLMSSTECKREPNYQSILTENMLCAASPDWSTDACKVSIHIFLNKCIKKTLEIEIKAAKL